MNTNELTRYTNCINFAAIKHRDQRRLDSAKTPYINHPIGVANILAAAGESDLNLLMSAILHDTVEDTDTSFSEIEENFGKEVRAIVEEVTDDKSLPKLERKRLQIEHASHCSHKAKLLKLADKLYNLRDLLSCTPEGWTEERSREYVKWAKQVVDNLRGSNAKLEESLDEIFRSQGLLQ